MSSKVCANCSVGRHRFCGARVYPASHPPCGCEVCKDRDKNERDYQKECKRVHVLLLQEIYPSYDFKGQTYWEFLESKSKALQSFPVEEWVYQCSGLDRAVILDVVNEALKLKGIFPISPRSEKSHDI